MFTNISQSITPRKKTKLKKYLKCSPPEELSKNTTHTSTINISIGKNKCTKDPITWDPTKHIYVPTVTDGKSPCPYLLAFSNFRAFIGRVKDLISKCVQNAFRLFCFKIASPVSRLSCVPNKNLFMFRLSCGQKYQ